MSVAVVGLGGRGLSVAQAFDDHPGAELRWLCDASREAQRRAGRRFPSVASTASVDALLDDETLDAIAISAPAAAHGDLVRRALEAQKHVLVEQPLATSAPEAEQLVTLARRRRRRLMVSNPTLFEPAMRKLKELLELGRLGEVYYVHVTAQSSPGPGEENVLWSLGVGALHTLLFLLEDQPVESIARADAYSRPGAVEVAACWFRFATGITAAMNLSWLDARDAERVTVVGSRRTAVLDTRALERKLTVYDQPAPRRPGAGEIVAPRIAAADPVAIECESFIARVRSGGEGAAPHAAAAAVALIDELDRTAAAEATAQQGSRQQEEPPPPRLELVQS